MTLAVVQGLLVEVFGGGLLAGGQVLGVLLLRGGQDRDGDVQLRLGAGVVLHRDVDHRQAEFAGRVRKAIFTWANIPRRIDPRDVPRIVREVDAMTITRALAGAAGDNAPTVGFLLSGLSSRLADSMREEMETIGKVTAKDAEEAMNAVVAAIRRMEQAGELFLLVEEEELDSAGPAG